MSPPRLRDVAERAAVSMTTASIVLRRQPGIRVSRQTQERVFRAADELGYTLREASPAVRLVGFATGGLDAASTGLVEHLVAAGAERGCLVVLLPAHPEQEVRPLRLPDLIGMIRLAGREPAVRALEAPSHVRSVVVDLAGRVDPAESAGAAVVVPDDVEAARRIGATLRLRGHRHVALVAASGDEAVVGWWRPALAAVLGEEPALWVASGGRLRSGQGPTAQDGHTALLCTSPAAAAALRRGDLDGPALAPRPVVLVRGSASRHEVPGSGVPLPLARIAAEAIDVTLAARVAAAEQRARLSQVPFELDGFDVAPAG